MFVVSLTRDDDEKKLVGAGVKHCGRFGMLTQLLSSDKLSAIIIIATSKNYTLNRPIEDR